MNDFNNLGTPWWVTSSGSGPATDYTRHRSTAVTYTMDDLIGWKNNLVNNNYSFVYSTGSNHTNATTWPGVTWDGNFFNSTVKGDAANNAKIKEVELKIRNGWRSIKPGSLDISRFELTREMLSERPKKVSNVQATSP